jgi:hypothetical protein
MAGKRELIDTGREEAEAMTASFLHPTDLGEN